MRLVLTDGAPDPEPDPALVRLIVQAHRLRRMLIAHEGRSVASLAEAAGISVSYFSRVVRLGFLPPGIAEAILDGTQPVAPTAAELAHVQDLPVRWAEARSLLGFPARQRRREHRTGMAAAPRGRPPIVPA